MRIPQIGLDVLYVIKAASEGQPAVYRGAKITSVSDYSPAAATVNLCIFVDGSNDAEMLGVQPESLKNMPCIWRTSCVYDAKGERGGTWCFGEEQYERAGRSRMDLRIEEIKVVRDITHGRETIRKDAVGIWDQRNNTIRFRAEDINGMHADHQPEYDASTFIDWHVARLEMPEGYITLFTPANTRDGRERPDERRRFMEDTFEEWERRQEAGIPVTPWPSTISRRWWRGDEMERRRQHRLEGEQRAKELEQGKQQGVDQPPKVPVQIGDNEDRQRQQSRPRQLEGVNS